MNNMRVSQKKILNNFVNNAFDNKGILFNEVGIILFSNDISKYLQMGLNSQEFQKQ